MWIGKIKFPAPNRRPKRVEARRRVCLKCICLFMFSFLRGELNIVHSTTGPQEQQADPKEEARNSSEKLESD